MALRHLQTRFILAGLLLAAATVASSVWSAFTFAQLATVVDETLLVSRETIDLCAEVAGSIEREDDALLLALSGDIETARLDLLAERRSGDRSFERLQGLLQSADAQEQALAARVKTDIDSYRAAGDELLAGSEPGALERYHRQVNPRLRQAAASCAKLREINFRSMSDAGVRAAAEANRGTRVVGTLALIAVLIGAAVSIWLGRSVVVPVRELTASVEAIRQNDFMRRAAATSSDELGQLASGFNRMAESLAEYRRSSLGELLAAKTTLEATLDALPEAVLVFAPDGSLASLNKPGSSLLRAAGAGEATQLDALPFGETRREAVAAALAGKRVSGELPDLRQTFDVVLSGARRKFLVTAAPIPEFTPGRCGAVAVLDDVTEFVRLDELRSELIGVASHELKSPLTTLRMNLLMLEEQLAAVTGPQRQLVAAAVEGCEELRTTIDELLDVTRIEAGQLRLNLAPVDLAGLMASVERGLRARFADAGVSLDIVRDGPSCVMLGDASRLASVLANVLTNALKYSPAGAKVAVRLSAQPRSGAQNGATERLQIAVSDRGPGIPAEYRERVFEKFFRVEHHLGQNADGVRGTGIGLYLCREIVKAHGGTIWCEAGEDGQGARIAISLPVEPAKLNDE